MRHVREDYERFQDPAGLIPKDEPVFLIRGRDLCAPVTLEHYASLVESRGGQKEWIRAVRTQARAMRSWQKTISPKMPDMP